MQGARDEGEGGGGGIAPSPSFQPLFALTSLFIFSIALQRIPLRGGLSCFDYHESNRL
jgi:hypothetical protein